MPEPRPAAGSEIPDGPLGMAGSIVAFSRLLKDAGLPTHPRAVADACRSVAALDLGDRRQVYWALRANLVSDQSRYEAFDRLYRLFWDEGLRRLPQPPNERLGSLPVRVPAPPAPPDAPPDFDASAPRRTDGSGGASADEVLLRKDLRTLAPREEPRLREILQSLLAKLATRPGRRTRPTPRGRGRGLALRSTFRRSARTGGELLTLVRRERKVRKRRVAFLGDVSGSMDAYSRFFLLVAHALARQEPGVEVYAFSTRLFRLTDFVRDKDASRALARLSEETRGWSGGTRIGECLAEFHRELRRRPHLKDTVVVILSDGWDRGDPDLLRREMIRLKAATGRVYWLNPLVGDPDYRPLCRGMAAARPYLDGFHPAHSVEALARFARQLVRLR
ncbi:MAG: VWA domain-containing protein [Thermodesulfobacteriota bacterium]